MADYEGVIGLDLYPTDNMFNQSERLLVIGASNTGKTYLVESMVKRYVDRFYKIVICGNRNRLLEFPETKDISELYVSDNNDNLIYNPFCEMDAYDLKKKGEKNSY